MRPTRAQCKGFKTCHLTLLSIVQDIRLASSLSLVTRHSSFKESQFRRPDTSPFTRNLLSQLVTLCHSLGIKPVVIGESIEDNHSHNLGDFYKDPFFLGTHNIAKQLFFFDTLFRSHGGVAHIGMMSGAMDGPALLLSHNVIFLAKREHVRRMEKVSKVVPNLHWQQVSYRKSFRDLSDSELDELKQTLIRILPDPKLNDKAI